MRRDRPERHKKRTKIGIALLSSSVNIGKDTF
jgi:hypothetical protein